MFLLDGAADVNVISRRYVIQYDLPSLQEASLPKAFDFQGRKSYVHAAYRLTVRVQDSLGVEKDTTDIFYAVEMDSPDVILGRPWRH